MNGGELRRKLVVVLCAIALLAGGAGIVVSVRAAAAAGGKTNRVLVASADIPPGTPVSELGNRVRQADLPAGAVPAGAVTDPANVAGLKTTVPIFADQILVSRQFGEVAATGGLPIPPGHNAVSAELDDPQRVAGFVQPGSQVIVYAVASRGEEETASEARVLLKSATVIAVGPATAAGGGDVPVDRKIVTFALVEADAAKLVAASAAGDLYLGLLPAEQGTK